MAKPGRPRKQKTKVLYIRLPETVHQALQAKAKEERRGLSDMICLVLEGKASILVQPNA